eukprot:TRINITY_DN2246_c0_g1_i5.p1 TRINITY_DN2246_c0_g1~~TRINITY_DN2246_c0_g1_i5.p1  ORF type:complete len:362 (-),score=35.29 TRINITY_DN2246_c0_g1_i5:49-1134(-)
MAEIFLGNIGHKLFGLVMFLYLFGDLAIYGVFIPNSVKQVTPNGTSIGPIEISGDDIFYVYLGIFTVILFPFCCSNFQKTKYLQIITMAIRNISLFGMMIIVIIYISQGTFEPPKYLVNFDGFPALFGVSIYSFMCHHSLPGIITPINSKKRIFRLFGGDFFTIYLTYISLCVTAVLAFGLNTNPTCLPHPGPPCKIQDSYIFNFASYRINFIAIFLQLFPVFTLSSNFPMIAITMRNNLKKLVKIGENWERQTLLNIIYSFVCVIPAMLLAALLRNNLNKLVEINGSYCGLCIMFLFPTFIVMFARRKAHKLWGSQYVNPYRSPFKGTFWVVFMFVCSAAALSFVIYRQVVSIIDDANHH